MMNRKFLLAARPVGMPKRTDWTLVEAPVEEPPDGDGKSVLEFDNGSGKLRRDQTPRLEAAAQRESE